jgi:hypothetical protein
MLNFFTAEMGMMGELSATVPATNFRICEERREGGREGGVGEIKRKKKKETRTPAQETTRKEGREGWRTYLFVLHGSVGGLDQIHLILQDDNIGQPHDFHCSQMLRGLRLRTSFITSNEEEGGVHDGRAVEHRGHLRWVGGREGGRENGEERVGKEVNESMMFLVAISTCT